MGCGLWVVVVNRRLFNYGVTGGFVVSSTPGRI